MDFRIDIMQKGTVCWLEKGGSPDASINQPPFEGPLLVVCMDRSELDELIDHATVEVVLSVWIDDTPTGVGPLGDGVLLGLARMIAEWLAHGGGVYLHCAAGASRASYIDIAVRCCVLGISANEALRRIKAQRPVADPNPGFLAQLQRLFPGA